MAMPLLTMVCVCLLLPPPPLLLVLDLERAHMLAAVALIRATPQRSGRSLWVRIIIVVPRCVVVVARTLSVHPHTPHLPPYYPA